MIVIYLLLVICFVHVESTDATSKHVYNATERLSSQGFNSSLNGSTYVPSKDPALESTTMPGHIATSEKGPGYAGCYPVGSYWQNVLGSDYRATSVDGCVSHCSNNNKSYAVISIRTCYCSNSLAGVQKVNDSRCNVNCNSNPRQICGSCRHYSVYHTTERLDIPGFNVSLNGSAYVTCIDSALESTTMPDSNASKDCTKELVDKCCSCKHLWLRIVIDVAVILGISFLIILILLVVRFCSNRQKGMFDEWKPRSFKQTRQVESGSSRSDDNLLHRNHSYQNLSGSSTQDRCLESVEQASAAMKGASARSPRAFNINLKKLTTGTSPAEMTNKGTSCEGEYFEQDFLQAPD